jgi:hypothetical protein
MVKVPSSFGADEGEIDSEGVNVGIKEGKEDKLGLLDINEGTLERLGMLDGILDGILEG